MVGPFFDFLPEKFTLTALQKKYSSISHAKVTLSFGGCGSAEPDEEKGTEKSVAIFS